MQGLTNDQKLYAHYLSRASYYGGLIVLQQTSPESVAIFRLLRMTTAFQTPAELRERAISKVSEEDFNHFMVYCAGFFANMGNYKSFGDSKFVPGLPAEELEKIFRVSEGYKKVSGASCRDLLKNAYKTFFYVWIKIMILICYVLISVSAQD